jgi:predicted membrane channel-forming protein YqfA (hemolysin III family)
MNKLRISFLLSLFGLSLVCVGLAELVAQPSNDISIILFFTISTWAVFEWVLIDIRPDSFMRNYLLSIVLKITLGCSFIAILLVAFKEKSVLNTLLFVVGYVLYTALEIFFLLKARKGA